MPVRASRVRRFGRSRSGVREAYAGRGFVFDGRSGGARDASRESRSPEPRRCRSSSSRRFRSRIDEDRLFESIFDKAANTSRYEMLFEQSWRRLAELDEELSVAARRGGATRRSRCRLGAAAAAAGIAACPESGIAPAATCAR